MGTRSGEVQKIQQITILKNFSCLPPMTLQFKKYNKLQSLRTRRSIRYQYPSFKKYNKLQSLRTTFASNTETLQFKKYNKLQSLRTNYNAHLEHTGSKNTTNYNP